MENRRPFLDAAEHMLVECQFYDEERHWFHLQGTLQDIAVDKPCSISAVLAFGSSIGLAQSIDLALSLCSLNIFPPHYAEMYVMPSEGNLAQICTVWYNCKNFKLRLICKNQRYHWDLWLYHVLGCVFMYGLSKGAENWGYRRNCKPTIHWPHCLQSNLPLDVTDLGGSKSVGR